MRLISSFVIAFATYSRLPMPRVDWTEENRRYALCFFPLIGAVIGLALYLWLFLCRAAGFGSLLKGAVAAALPVLITGGIHLYGFMDTRDAMASWQEPARRLEILKDSHVGAFAVMGCALYLLLEAGLLSELSGKTALAAMACFVLSRALSAWLSVALKQARPGGMLDGFASTAAGRAVKLSAVGYILICFVFMALLKPLSAALCAAVTALTILYYKKMTAKYFGGVTGDLAGWFLCVQELLSLAAALIGGMIA